MKEELTLRELVLAVPAPSSRPFLEALGPRVLEQLPAGERPVRFVVSKTGAAGFECEMGVLAGRGAAGTPQFARDEIFRFLRHARGHADHFTSVMLVPTGVGADIGGHSGDAGPAARLIGAVSDTVITHPNVGNAADINELPANALYVEGSVITRFLMGRVGLARVRSNRVLVTVAPHPARCFVDATVNMVSAARAAAGITCPLVAKLRAPLNMESVYAASGRASGRIDGFEGLCEVLDEHRGAFDAVAIASLVTVPEHYHRHYFDEAADQMVNPWGGVEAMLTHAVSLMYQVPSAHAPMMTSRAVQTLELGAVDPRKAAEPVSTTYLFSSLKGLHRSPRIVPLDGGAAPGNVLTSADVDCLVIPDGCVALPTLAAVELDIPVIAVRGNRNRMRASLDALPFAPGRLIRVENYLEAAGAIAALRAGVSLESVRRPIPPTPVRD